MKLKDNITAVDYFKAIDKCAGDVLLHTREGDVLNLRSKLCRYIFAIAAVEEGFFRDAQVVCKSEADYLLLSDFLEQ